MPTTAALGTGCRRPLPVWNRTCGDCCRLQHARTCVGEMRASTPPVHRLRSLQPMSQPTSCFAWCSPSPLSERRPVRLRGGFAEGMPVLAGDAPFHTRSPSPRIRKNEAQFQSTIDPKRGRCLRRENIHNMAHETSP